MKCPWCNNTLYGTLKGNRDTYRCQHCLQVYRLKAEKDGEGQHTKTRKPGKARE